MSTTTARRDDPAPRALGYEPRIDSPAEDLVDAHDRGPAFWFEQMKEARPDGGGAIPRGRLLPVMAVVFLLDLDNTLVDNDAVRERLNEDTRRLLGATQADRFWKVYEEVRDECGYVDFLETLGRFHGEAGEPTHQLELDRLILDFPYAEARYPATLEVLAALWRAGTPVVLSDGDPIFQPLKVFRSGVAEAVRGNVLVFPHKETCLDAVARLFPADRYVAVDDKAAILSALKTQWGERLTTVHVLQGKYADDAYTGPSPDHVLKGIGEMTALVAGWPAPPESREAGAF